MKIPKIPQKNDVVRFRKDYTIQIDRFPDPDYRIDKDTLALVIDHHTSFSGEIANISDQIELWLVLAISDLDLIFKFNYSVHPTTLEIIGPHNPSTKVLFES